MSLKKLVLIFLLSSSLVAMQQPDSETLLKNKKNELFALINQTSSLKFKSIGEETKEAQSIQTKTNELVALAYAIKGKYSQKNPMPESYYNTTFGNLEELAQSAVHNCHPQIYESIAALRVDLLRIKRIFYLDPCDLLTNIRWVIVTEKGIVGDKWYSYNKLTADFKNEQKRIKLYYSGKDITPYRKKERTKEPAQ